MKSCNYTKKSVVMAEPKKPVNEKFNAIIKALNTNAHQIAQKLNLKRADKYYRIEKGLAKPSFDTLQGIISIFPQINANYFFKDDDPMFIDKGSYLKDPDELLQLQVKHLQQKVALLESQNQELLTQLLQLKAQKTNKR